MSHLLKTHWGGWRPSLPVDLPGADTTGIRIRAEVDPRENMPAVFNQWALGSCTANATCAAFEYDAILDNKPVQLSRLWTYYQERKKEGSLGEGDTGAIGHDAFWAATHVGICPEHDWPYTWPGMTEDQPAPESVFDPAKPPMHTIKDEGYYKLEKPYVKVPRTQRAIKQALSNNQTVAFGFAVYESFESPEVARTGVVPMPDPDERILGGHEVLVVGYLRSEPHYALVRNSWGVGWGIAGYCLFPWAYLLDRSLSSDWVTIRRPIGA